MTDTMIVEINGTKFEVDTRNAKRVDTLRIGPRVKVLVKQEYSTDKYKVHPGVVIGFDEFTELPTITVAYLECDYSGAKLRWVAINAQQKNIDIVAATDEDNLELSRDDVLATMDRSIATKRLEIDELESQRKFFLAQFGEYFGAIIKEPS